MTNIELSNEDAQLFIKFRQYQDIFQRILEQGVFNQNIVQATLYFNKCGTLTTIDKTIRHTYPLDK